MELLGRLALYLLGSLIGPVLDWLVGAPVPGAAANTKTSAVTHPALAPPARRHRWMRLPLVVVPASILAGAVFLITFGAPALMASQPRPTPHQPIPFDHRTHVQQLGLQCAFCHQTAGTDVSAGMPSTETCMGCHVPVGTTREPAIQGLQDAWIKQQAINWVDVSRMPDDVRFVHDAHVQAGVACQECHGDVGAMHQVVQGQPMKMQQCVACHQRTGAPTTCATCHY